MPKEELENARAALRQLLPQALRDLMQQYQHYLTTHQDYDPAEFGRFNTAGKNAIAHIQLLLKLYREMDDVDAMNDDLRHELAEVMAELEDRDA